MTFGSLISGIGGIDLWVDWKPRSRGVTEVAKNNGYDKDMKTGREPKDAQMRGLQKAMGTPTRQAELPPYIGKFKLPVDPKVETD